MFIECPACGSGARVPDRLVGRKVRCARCQGVVRVGEKKPTPPPAAAARPVAAAPSSIVTAAPRSRHARWYWLLALAFLPLAVISFSDEGAQQKDLVKRLVATLKSEPVAVAKRAEGLLTSGAPIGDVLEALPEKRIQGAFLTHDSWDHWGFAVASAILFVVTLSILFPWTSPRDSDLLLVALFTGTFGILFLYVAQVVCIPAYFFAEDPSASIFGSMFGYTMGVGLCEELAKALPVIVYFASKRDMDWRRACHWGFASGVGFGVSEAIQYSGDTYNGLLGRDIYFVRFVSCVALHAIWAASAAVVLCENKAALSGGKLKKDKLLLALAAPMVLHGFYDTLLKHDENVLALLTALGSFWWFASEIERLTRGAPASAPGRPSLTLAYQ